MKIVELIEDAKISLEQEKAGSWTSIAVLVDGKKAFRAVKTIGPGAWEVFKVGSSTSLGTAISKTEIKDIVRKQLNLKS